MARAVTATSSNRKGIRFTFSGKPGSGEKQAFAELGEVIDAWVDREGKSFNNCVAEVLERRPGR